MGHYNSQLVSINFCIHCGIRVTMKQICKLCELRQIESSMVLLFVNCNKVQQFSYELTTLND